MSDGMMDDFAGTPAQAYLQSQVANILAHRQRQLVDALRSPDAGAVDALVREVIAALEAEMTDPTADYHAYHHEPLPKAHEIEAAIRARGAELQLTTGRQEE